MIKIEVEIQEEQLKNIFEEADIKYSKAKAKKLKEIVSENEFDIREVLEEALAEQLNDIIIDEWEK